jgi:hypothetical protein
MNSLEQLYTVALIQSIVVQYCYMENSKKSNLEEINYKNLCKIKS